MVRNVELSHLWMIVQVSVRVCDLPVVDLRCRKLGMERLGLYDRSIPRNYWTWSLRVSDCMKQR